MPCSDPAISLTRLCLELRRLLRRLTMNSINPIRVLHTAVAAAGIAETGPILPLLNEISAADYPAVKQAAVRLLGVEQEASQVE